MHLDLFFEVSEGLIEPVVVEVNESRITQWALKVLCLSQTSDQRCENQQSQTILQSIGHVAPETGVLRSLNRRTAKSRTKLLFTHSCQFLKRRREFTRRERLFVRERSAAIPRAHILTDVTAENMIRQRSLKLSRNVAALLNR